MGVDGPVMNIQYVYAGWLNGSQAMAPGVLQQLEAAGLDDEDFQQILSTNPFQSGSTVIDADRYIALPESFAYEPPYSSADAPWLATYTVQNTTTATNTVTVEYSVAFSLSVSVPIIDIFSAGSSMTFTNTNTSTTTETTVETASVTVGGPSFGYPNTHPSTSGPTSILVYWDSVYHSFMFAFPAGGVAPDARAQSRSKPGAAKAPKARKAAKKPARARRPQKAH
jgi:hypothetical protein